jgi:hypothetical protein
MLEKHANFKAYWESIGKPKFEVLRKLNNTWVWLFPLPNTPNWESQDYRIKDDPHWELRREWVDSDFMMPIEYYNSDDEEWIIANTPTWNKDYLYRKAQNEDNAMLTKPTRRAD